MNKNIILKVGPPHSNKMIFFRDASALFGTTDWTLFSYVGCTVEGYLSYRELRKRKFPRYFWILPPLAHQSWNSHHFQSCPGRHSSGLSSRHPANIRWKIWRTIWWIFSTDNPTTSIYAADIMRNKIEDMDLGKGRDWKQLEFCSEHWVHIGH